MNADGRRPWTPGWKSVVIFIALVILAHISGWGDEVGREVLPR